MDTKEELKEYLHEVKEFLLKLYYQGYLSLHKAIRYTRQHIKNLDTYDSDIIDNLHKKYKSCVAKIHESEQPSNFIANDIAREIETGYHKPEIEEPEKKHSSIFHFNRFDAKKRKDGFHILHRKD
jgi:hypothetical protein